jgi:hypothetical protein
VAARERYGARRNWQTQEVRAVITVVCDDTKTAVRYFDALRQEFKEHETIRVHPAPRHGASGDAVVQHAIDQKPKGQYAEADDGTFALIDLDTNPNRQALTDAAEAGGVQVLFSNPCFEVWTLAHLEDTGQAFVDCAAVLQRIKYQWRQRFGNEFGDKSQADYSKLMPVRQAAVDRCRQRTSANSQSWTQVWRVVAFILGDG